MTVEKSVTVMPACKKYKENSAVSTVLAHKNQVDEHLRALDYQFRDQRPRFQRLLEEARYFCVPLLRLSQVMNHGQSHLFGE